MSDILSKKHEIMVTARLIMDSLREMFGQYNVEMNRIEYNMTTLLQELQTFQSLKGQKEGEGKSPTAAVEGKWKAKVAIKGKCFHYNVDGRWKRNCPKYLVKKKENKATDHVCYSLQKTSSLKQLEEDEMTLKVRTGDVNSASAVEDVK
ncbi:gag/pol protein [Cucumis melo var. makuwa]|uniref:Gag/pol protein n=1 Tax=Cucumis melo var. makuwa TaxID=1194695 RepID=A0A5A7UMZ1_CUCMM|nr:gag/pol protein [Cucumis melo var. makuwa]